MSTVPDIITYRLDGDLVYVKPSLDYNEAIALAIKEFPHALAGIPHNRIRFSILAVVKSGRERKDRMDRTRVRISESAWAKTLEKMVKCEIVELEVIPEIEGVAGRGAKGTKDLKETGLEKGVDPSAPPGYTSYEMLQTPSYARGSTSSLSANLARRLSGFWKDLKF
ncbi:hypothetical protein K435DRAFT_806220 [Dendrothele bispora CBS 962.96]|uniref:Uncharacterized protein n=1 Tax=Dendrothele bispora (strain CBS 962.96) TaxID=1314807 RepID=A0A4S8L8Z4_DENBC|nr:hypothetical protein K435DRAFT_806220 [Dendrothele bispora CBS 962.96]